MKKEPYKQQVSSEMAHSHRAPLSGKPKTQGGLRQKLCLADNRDAVRELTWLIRNVGKVKDAWVQIESAYQEFSSPNVKARIRLKAVMRSVLFVSLVRSGFGLVCFVFAYFG